MSVPGDKAADLQKSIDELYDFSPHPAAAWVARVQSAPIPVIAGAILRWSGGGGVGSVPDPYASKREAAQAILQARLSAQASEAMTTLQQSIDTYQIESGMQTRIMVNLTRTIAGLTALMLAGLLVQILLAWYGH